MKKSFIGLLAGLVLLGGFNRVLAQAPASLAEFTNSVLVLTVSNSSVHAVSAVRIFNNSKAASSGNLLLVGVGFGPTNVAYAQQASDRGLMSLYSSPGASYLETNHLTMTFATTTNGVFTNQIVRPSIPLQTNNGTFKLTPGTNIPPLITFVTADQIVQTNDSRSLSISAAGFGIAYQWKFNGGNYGGSGSQTASISLNNIQPANVGNYFCVLSNSAGVVTSAVINVSFAVPAGFTTQPQSQAVVEGSYLTLSFVATGSVSSIAWYSNGSLLPNSTNSSYSIANMQVANAGNYYAVLGNYGASVTSQVAAVTVIKAGVNSTWLNRPFVKVADDRTPVPGQPAHWMTNWASPSLAPLLTFRDGKVHFVAGTTAGVRSLFRWTNGVLSTLVFTNTPNPLGGFFSDVFYPTDEGGGVVNFNGNSVPYGMFARSASGVSNIINFNTAAPGRPYYFGGTGSFGRRGNGVAISSALFSTPGSFSIVGAGMYFFDGTNITRLCDDSTPLPGGLSGYGSRPTANSVNFDGTNIVFSTTGVSPGNRGGFFKSTTGGVITKLAVNTDPSPQFPGSTFTNFGDIDVDGGLIFGAANGIIYTFDGNGSVTNIAFSQHVSAAGPRMVYYHDGGYLYRWNDGVIQSVLNQGGLVDGKAMTQILGMDAQGDDVCVALKFSDNSYGIYIVSGVGSNAPVILSEPMDFNAIDHGNASFHVTVTGNEPLTYQWYKGTSLLTDRTNASLYITNVQNADLAGYSVIASNMFGSVTSRVAQLTLSVPTIPLLLSGPSIQGITLFGSNITLVVLAAGEPLTYQWIKNGLPLDGATSAALQLPNIGATDRTNYAVAISNANGGFVTTPITLNILPIIRQSPVSTTNVVGGTAVFTVVADGVPPLTYQWRRGPVSPTINIPGATDATLTLTNLSLTNAQFYRVAVTSTGNGTIFSVIVSLTVLSGGTPNSPQLSAPVVVSGQFRFLLPTETGYSYLVQSATNLASPSWTLETTIPGDGTVKLVALDAGPVQKLVRVQAQ